jgi:hypothetical protein
MNLRTSVINYQNNDKKQRECQQSHYHVPKYVLISSEEVAVAETTHYNKIYGKKLIYILQRYLEALKYMRVSVLY